MLFGGGAVVVGIGWQKIEMFIGNKMYVKRCR